jgi:HPr kinase/phosphorylase
MASVLSEFQHGVMMNIEGLGVLFIGQAKIGKSTLALELLHDGYQLVSDDSVEFTINENDRVVGTSPHILSGLLHCRELGVLDITSLFGQQSIKEKQRLDYVIELIDEASTQIVLSIEPRFYQVCEHNFPKLTLNVHSIASIKTRLLTWLKMQSVDHHAEDVLRHRQIKEMKLQ